VHRRPVIAPLPPPPPPLPHHHHHRRLDLRLCDDTTTEGGQITISHRFPSSLGFAECLSEIKAFLDDNPSECIFVCIKRDWDRRQTWNSGAAALAMLEDSGLRFATYPPSTNRPPPSCCNSSTMLDTQPSFANVRLQSVRGCVCLSSQDDAMWTGSDGASLVAELPGKMDLDFGFHDMWDAGSVQRCQTAIETNVLAHEPCETVTGFSTNVVQGCGIVMPKHVAWLMNAWLLRRCESEAWRGRALGFVVVDFASPDLVRAILQCNFLPGR
jgi:hypothetical protein